MKLREKRMLIFYLVDMEKISMDDAFKKFYNLSKTKQNKLLANFYQKPDAYTKKIKKHARRGDE